MAEKPGEFDTRHYLKSARETMKQVVTEQMQVFRQTGHVGDYEPASLHSMAVRYAREGYQLCTT